MAIKSLKMKRYLILSILFIIVASATIKAQDVIVKTDNSTIICKVEEITTEVVKYHKWDNLEGPIYHLNISEIVVINFSNGTSETFTTKSQERPINTIEYPKEPKDENSNTVLNTVDFLQRDDLLRSARGYRIGGIICLSAGMVSLLSGVAVGAVGEGGIAAALICGGVGGAVLGGILKGKSIRLENEAYALERLDILEMRLGDTNAYASLCSTHNPVINKSNVGVGFIYKF